MVNPTKPAMLKHYARLSEKRKGLFFEALAQGWSITKACDESELSPPTVYQWRMDNPEFAKQWDDAIEQGTDVLEDALLKRAAHGITRHKFHQGRAIMVPCKKNDKEAIRAGEDADGKPIYLRPYTEQEYSDTLGIFLLKGRRPKYRDTFKAEISGPDGGPIVLQALAELENKPGLIVDSQMVREAVMRRIEHAKDEE